MRGLAALSGALRRNRCLELNEFWKIRRFTINIGTTTRCWGWKRMHKRQRGQLWAGGWLRVRGLAKHEYFRARLVGSFYPGDWRVFIRDFSWIRRFSSFQKVSNRTERVIKSDRICFPPNRVWKPFWRFSIIRDRSAAAAAAICFIYLPRIADRGSANYRRERKKQQTKKE